MRRAWYIQWVNTNSGRMVPEAAVRSFGKKGRRLVADGALEAQAGEAALAGCHEPQGGGARTRYLRVSLNCEARKRRAKATKPWPSRGGGRWPAAPVVCAAGRLVLALLTLSTLPRAYPKAQPRGVGWRVG